jgi:hypothetical protein
MASKDPAVEQGAISFAPGVVRIGMGYFAVPDRSVLLVQVIFNGAQPQYLFVFADCESAGFTDDQPRGGSVLRRIILFEAFIRPSSTACLRTRRSGIAVFGVEDRGTVSGDATLSHENFLLFTPMLPEVVSSNFSRDLNASEVV